MRSKGEGLLVGLGVQPNLEKGSAAPSPRARGPAAHQGGGLALSPRQVPPAPPIYTPPPMGRHKQLPVGSLLSLEIDFELIRFLVYLSY